MTSQQRNTLRHMMAIVTLAAAGAAVAMPHGGPRHEGMAMPFGKGMTRMLDDVGATADQKAQIEKITEAARADLRAGHEAGQALREQTRQLFAQPTVDAAAAESLRQQMLAQHDRATQRMMQAMVEASQVLTAEQRQKLAERMKQRADKAQQHRHGERHGERHNEHKGG